MFLNKHQINNFFFLYLSFQIHLVIPLQIHEQTHRYSGLLTPKIFGIKISGTYIWKSSGTYILHYSKIFYIHYAFIQKVILEWPTGNAP